MHNFDRGIIKWLPFDALSGLKGAIEKLKERRSKIDKPNLSTDQLEALDETLRKAYYYKSPVTVYYYLKGMIYYLVGYVNKIDHIYKRIKVENKYINSVDIINIELKE